MKTYLAMQNDIIVFADTSREVVENLPKITITRIEETEEPVENVQGIYWIGEERIKDAKKQMIRDIRNGLLEKEVDPVVSNPLRWADMSEEDQNDYLGYRLYLLNYTEKPMWWEKEPLDFEEWKSN